MSAPEYRRPDMTSAAGAQAPDAVGLSVFSLADVEEMRATAAHNAEARLQRARSATFWDAIAQAHRWVRPRRAR